jgi:hypothetical protein
MLSLLEVAGLILEILGSILLLIEAVKFRLKNQHLEVCVDEKGYHNRLRIRIAGITLLLIGFVLQLFEAIARMTT